MQHGIGHAKLVKEKFTDEIQAAECPSSADCQYSALLGEVVQGASGIGDAKAEVKGPAWLRLLLRAGRPEADANDKKCANTPKRLIHSDNGNHLKQHYRAA